MRVRVAKAVRDARLESLEGLRVRGLGPVSNRLADVLIFHEFYRHLLFLSIVANPNHLK